MSNTITPIRPFKPAQFINPALLADKLVAGRPVADLLNHASDVVQGVQSIMGLLEARRIDQSCDTPLYLNGHTAGALERLAIRALGQLGHEVEALRECIQADARAVANTAQED